MSQIETVPEDVNEELRITKDMYNRALRRIEELEVSLSHNEESEFAQQELYEQFRALRNDYQALQELLEREKADIKGIRAKHLRWESELNAKLKLAREEIRTLKEENECLKQELLSKFKLNK
jgi:outer membrane receptor for ferrienterochelin and colicin